MTIFWIGKDASKVVATAAFALIPFQNSPTGKPCEDTAYRPIEVRGEDFGQVFTDDKTIANAVAAFQLPEAQLRAIAEQHRPPQSWFDAEEDLF